MQIETIHIKNSELNNYKKIFHNLLEEKMYHAAGIFREVWDIPSYFIKDEAYLSLAKFGENLAGLLFISKNQWYDWEYDDKNLKSTYGMIGFYTKPEFREKGVAKTLFNKFDDEIHIRKLASSGIANNIISSVSKNEKVLVK